MRGRERFLESQEIQSRRRGCDSLERFPLHFPTEAVMLQIAEARGALDVCQRLRSSVQPPLKHLPVCQRRLELTDEFLEVVLNDAVEVDQLAVDVVEHLDVGGRPLEEQRGAAGENLDVAFMPRKSRNDVRGETPLAAHPGNDWICH